VIAKVSPSGLFYQFGLISRIANERTEQILSMLIRGLHQYYLHDLLPKATPFIFVRLFEREHFEEVSRMIDTLDGGYDIIGNGDVFSCAYASFPGILYWSVWELNFYRRVVFAALTNPLGQVLALPY
jgi:hypothetical protein